MKDPNDSATIDALDAPRRGRPRKADSLSNAERQRRHRERLRDAGSITVTLTPDEAQELLRALTAHRLEIADINLERCNSLVPLQQRLIRALSQS